ncbi:MAG: NF038143 family protein [Deltaproteobacteria bacterium]|nr:NF038143 family protein [Deltaproteobacteria bacterium]
MESKHAIILAEEEAFARQVALGVIIFTPQSVFHYLIPFMFVLDFLRRNTTIRNYTKHFMFPRRLAIDAAMDILRGEERTKRVSEIGPHIEAWLAELKLPSASIRCAQMEVIDLLVDHYMILLQAQGDTFNELIRSAYQSRYRYQEFLDRYTSKEEELDRAILEYLGGSEKLREKFALERTQFKRLSEKRLDQIFAKPLPPEY